MKNWFIKARPLFALTLIFIFIAACSSGGGDDGSVGPDPTPPIEIIIAQIAVDTDPSTINVTETSAIKAMAYDDSGSPIPGVSISFSLDQPSLAAISPPSVVTDDNGIANATLTARDKVGTVKIKATSGETTSNEESVAILSGVSPDKINVTATPSTIMVEGTATVLAEVLDKDDKPVPDGTSVAFEVSNETFGKIVPADNTTVNGFASATFTALNQPGTATVEVSVGNINNSVDILINQSQPASLEFLSATPQRITIAGSGGTETSEIKFTVIDENGNSVSGIKVTVNIESGPNGGEYIDNDTTPKEIEVSTDAEGVARVILRSGTLAGPVTLKGTIKVEDRNGEIVTFTVNSSIVSIGGGVPVASRFSISAEPRNVPGLSYNGVTTDITAWMSDRYGNYNILKGTAVSFWSEAALSVDAANATVNEDGVATVKARTQHPVLSVNMGGQDVDPWPWEEELLEYVQDTYLWGGITHPRDGWASVGVYTQGEEHFDDLNANGLYDSNEPFEDTYEDPFLDYNDNDIYNYLGVDPAEIFNDVNSTGGWSSYDQKWNAQKDIFASSQLLITGEPIILFSEAAIANPNGGRQIIKVLVCDRNLNYMSAGTEMSMTFEVDIENGDKLVGAVLKEREYFDSSYLPPRNGSMSSHLFMIEYTVEIYDKNPGFEISAPVLLTVTVDWDGIDREGTFENSISGTSF